MNSRRTFLKGSAAGMAFSILPSSLRGASAPSNQVNLVMIGVGRQGVNANMGTFLGMSNVRVVAVCDVDRMHLKRAKGLVDLELQYQYANGVVLDYKIDVPYLRGKATKGGFRRIGTAKAA